MAPTACKYSHWYSFLITNKNQIEYSPSALSNVLLLRGYLLVIALISGSLACWLQLSLSPSPLMSLSSLLPSALDNIRFTIVYF